MDTRVGELGEDSDIGRVLKLGSWRLALISKVECGEG